MDLDFAGVTRLGSGPLGPLQPRSVVKGADPFLSTEVACDLQQRVMLSTVRGKSH